MRFDHGFHCVFQVDENIDPTHVGIPPMLVQPLVENAILHGLRPKIKAGSTNAVLKIFIGGAVGTESLVIQVEDNGIGREASRKNRSGDEGEKRSAAMRILESRLKALQKETGKHHSVKVEDLNEGTRISLVLSMHQEWEDND
jgi:LytS/YehU family sensor histidine kinase